MMILRPAPTDAEGLTASATADILMKFDAIVAV
jgi:hypothetical protein